MKKFDTQELTIFIVSVMALGMIGAICYVMPGARNMLYYMAYAIASLVWDLEIPQ